ncbi:MAG: hypothetical protein ACE5EV_08120 [Gaiellales bacterium]
MSQDEQKDGPFGGRLGTPRVGVLLYSTIDTGLASLVAGAAFVIVALVLWRADAALKEAERAAPRDGPASPGAGRRRSKRR